MREWWGKKKNKDMAKAVEQLRDEGSRNVEVTIGGKLYLVDRPSGEKTTRMGEKWQRAAKLQQNDPATFRELSLEIACELFPQVSRSVFEKMTVAEFNEALEERNKLFR